MRNIIDLNQYDPEAGINAFTRSVMGPIKSGTVTFDEIYGIQTIFARWIYVGANGNLSYVKWDGTTETLPNVASGIWHFIPSIKINSSGTTIAANQLRWGS